MGIHESEEAADKAAWDQLHASRGLAKKPGPELMIRFDELIDQYDSQIGRLSMNLAPVLVQGGVDTPGYPEEAPYNDLHNRLLQFERLNRRLMEINELIKL